MPPRLQLPEVKDPLFHGLCAPIYQHYETTGSPSMSLFHWCLARGFVKLPENRATPPLSWALHSVSKNTPCLGASAASPRACRALSSASTSCRAAATSSGSGASGLTAPRAEAAGFRPGPLVFVGCSNHEAVQNHEGAGLAQPSRVASKDPQEGSDFCRLLQTASSPGISSADRGSRRVPHPPSETEGMPEGLGICNRRGSRVGRG